MNNDELRLALDMLEKEKGISKQAIIEAIELSLQTACKNHFGSADNVRVSMNPETAQFSLLADKTVVEVVGDPNTQISLEDARAIDAGYEPGDTVQVPIDSKSFSRIAAQNAKGVIVQKIREEERKILYEEYYSMAKQVVSGVVEKDTGRALIVNLGKVDGYLGEGEQIKGEKVRKLFFDEVSELREGIVEIKAISREAGSRTKMAVLSHDDDVDAVGACVGLNGTRVNTIVEELRGEKIDIINYDENPAYLIENALSPAKVIAVIADQDNKDALVIVPDNQLSLAIGKEGQNARLAAKLTNYKIDIKSESQAQEQGIFDEMGIDYHGESDSDTEDYEQGSYEDEELE